jgi:hypothetical protein
VLSSFLLWVSFRGDISFRKFCKNDGIQSFGNSRNRNYANQGTKVIREEQAESRTSKRPTSMMISFFLRNNNKHKIGILFTTDGRHNGGMSNWGTCLNIVSGPVNVKHQLNHLGDVF